MNKRIYFILFPIFALLFISNGKDDFNSISFTPDSYGTIITNIPVQNAAHSDVKKGEKSVNKYAFRIKAWDDTFALNVPAQWKLTEIAYQYTKAICQSYRDHISHVDPQVYSLRGPPSVV